MCTYMIISFGASSRPLNWMVVILKRYVKCEVLMWMLSSLVWMSMIMSSIYVRQKGTKLSPKDEMWCIVVFLKTNWLFKGDAINKSSLCETGLKDEIVAKGRKCTLFCGYKLAFVRVMLLTHHLGLYISFCFFIIRLYAGLHVLLLYNLYINICINLCNGYHGPLAYSIC